MYKITTSYEKKKRTGIIDSPERSLLCMTTVRTAVAFAHKYYTVIARIRYENNDKKINNKILILLSTKNNRYRKSSKFRTKIYNNKNKKK